MAGEYTIERGDGFPHEGAPQVMRRNTSYEVDERAPIGEIRSQALSTVERWEAPDEHKGAATRRLEDPLLERGVAAHISRFSNPAYVSARRQHFEDPTGFGDTLTPEERAAWRFGRQEARATLQTSGAVLPSPLDPTIVPSNAGSKVRWVRSLGWRRRLRTPIRASRRRV